MDKPTIFISYHHKDEEWKNKLLTHLKVLNYESSFEIWDERSLHKGDSSSSDLLKILKRSNIAILLISADFLASDDILHYLVPEILEFREKKDFKVYSIIIRACAWEHIKWLSSLLMDKTDITPLSVKTNSQIYKFYHSISEEIYKTLTESIKKSTEHNEFIPKKISLTKLPITRPVLIGRNPELSFLNNMWRDSNTNIVSLVAFGGVGKTALVNSWLRSMQKDNFRGAEMVYGWSFYSQGTSNDRQVSADAFIAETLRWFGDPAPDKGSPWQKGERLAEYVKKYRTLLILDGMEPLQDPLQQGQIKDHGLKSLLQELAFENQGLCIVTTRVNIDDLKDFLESTVKEIPLEKLSQDAGAELLASLGVYGTVKERCEASEEFDGHALALTLLGNYLAAEFEGDIRRRDEILNLLDEEDEGGHARRVLRPYMSIFKGKPELDILHLLGLFDHPVSMKVIEILIRAPIIQGLTNQLRKLLRKEWIRAVTCLRDHDLLSKHEYGDSIILDCHPLIREFFGEQLKNNNPVAWKEAHSRLYEYYKLSAKEYPDTIEEMEPLNTAVMHGCQAGRYQEAFNDIFWERILRKNESFGITKIGAFGSQLTVISNFFDRLWDQPAIQLNEPTKAFLFNAAGLRLRMLGKLRESVQPIKAGLEAQINQCNWANAAVSANNLSELCLIVGDIDISEDYAKSGILYAERSEIVSERINNLSTLAFLKHQAGLLNEALAGFQRVESIQHDLEKKYLFLHSLQGYRYCELLLSQGKYLDVKRRAEQTIEIAFKNNWLLDFALDTLSLGRAECMRVLLEVDIDFGEAGDILNRAVDDLRKAGQQDDLPRGLIARAELYRFVGDFEHAHRDLREVMMIVTRGEMRLFEADCRLQYGRLYLAEGDAVKAREELEQAEEMIEEMGYGRRRPEVQVDYARLLLHEEKREKAREYLQRGKNLVEEMGYHCLDVEVRELEGELG